MNGVKVYRGWFLRVGASRRGGQIGVQWNRGAHRQWLIWLPRRLVILLVVLLALVLGTTVGEWFWLLLLTTLLTLLGV